MGRTACYLLGVLDTTMVGAAAVSSSLCIDTILIIVPSLLLLHHEIRALLFARLGSYDS